MILDQYGNPLNKDSKNKSKKSFNLWKLFRKNILKVSVLIALIGLIADLTGIYSFYSITSKSKAKTTKVIFKKNDQRFKILILPLKPDKNCKNETSFYEDQISSRLNDLSSKNKVPLIAEIETSIDCPKSLDESKVIGQKANADLVIWGRYEEECDMKGKICIQYSLVKKLDIIPIESEGSSGLKTLRSLSELRNGYLQEDIDYIIYWTLGIESYKRSKYIETVKWLNKINQVDSCNIDFYELKGSALANSSDVKSAIGVFEKLSECYLNNPNYPYYLSNCYSRIFSPDLSSDSLTKVYLDKAIDIDSSFIFARIDKAYYKLGSIGEKRTRGSMSIELSDDSTDLEKLRMVYVNQSLNLKSSNLDTAIYNDLIREFKSMYDLIMKKIQELDSTEIEKREQWICDIGMLFSFRGDLNQLSGLNQKAKNDYSSTINATTLHASDSIVNKYYYIKHSLKQEALLKRALIYKIENKIDSMQLDIKAIIRESKITGIDYSDKINFIKDQEKMIELMLHISNSKPKGIIKFK